MPANNKTIISSGKLQCLFVHVMFIKLTHAILLIRMSRENPNLLIR